MRGGTSQGGVLPRRRPAGRPGRARRAAAADHGQPGPAADRRHRRRPAGDQQGRRRVALRRRRTATSTTCSCRSASTRRPCRDRQNCGNLLAARRAVRRRARAGRAPGRERDRACASAWSTPADARSRGSPPPAGGSTTRGDTAIAGVPGTAAPVALDFAGTEGSACGSLLPTGRLVDEIDGVAVTCVDNGMPVVVVARRRPRPHRLRAPGRLAATRRCPAGRALRLQAGKLMGLGDVTRTPPFPRSPWSPRRATAAAI